MLPLKLLLSSRSIGLSESTCARRIWRALAQYASLNTMRSSKGTAWTFFGGAEISRTRG